MDAISGDPAMGKAREQLAPAKVNLALHVVGRRADGYHDLESLVVFARDGDRLRVGPADADELVSSGPFGSRLPAGRDNIVTRALDLARATEGGRAIPPLRIEIEKNLPIASGIGGGSADAAALLRVVSRDWPATRRKALRDASLRLGADVPMCFDGRAARVSGVGEIAEPVVRLPRLHLLLVNPGVPVSTPAVFAALACRDNPALAALPPQGFATFEALVDALRASRNDLEAPALAIAPAIGEVLALLRAAGAPFARMSGSGATVFALFPDEADCRAAAEAVRVARPDWWTLASSVASREPFT